MYNNVIVLFNILIYNLIMAISETWNDTTTPQQPRLSLRK